MLIQVLCHPVAEGEAPRTGFSRKRNGEIGPGLTFLLRPFDLTRDEALALLKKKKNLRVLQLPEIMTPLSERPWQMKKVDGGLLVQDLDSLQIQEDTLNYPTKRKPNDAEWRDLQFAWKVVKHTKSNAIVKSLSSPGGSAAVTG